MSPFLTDQPIDPVSLRQSLLRKDAGGFCSFEGWVRDQHRGKTVVRLEYETYGILARKEAKRILDDALDQFEILDAVAVHRIGNLTPGELAVWTGVAAAHRDTAFSACRYLIEAIKHRIPIWKHEFYEDGTQGWVTPVARPREIYR